MIVGSSIDDNQQVEESHGTVRAYDAVTGALKWSFDPIARTDDAPNAASWQGRRSQEGGCGQCLGADERGRSARAGVRADLVTEPGFLGRLAPRRQCYANSVVALKIETGEVAWSFQTTHHDVWDYDLPAQPTLATITYKGQRVPAVLQPTKQGLLFTLDRDTGEPVIPVVERKVPQGGAPGEKLSPTQPFPIAPKPLAPSTIRPDQAYGLTFWDRGKCRDDHRRREA